MSEESPYQPGAILAGRYQVRRELGRGGMGMVYLCRDLVLDERIALKVLSRPGVAPRPEDAWWFREEARALAGLSHPVIVRARDFGTLSDGTPYLAMDAVPGRSLHEWIYLAKTDGLLPWPIVHKLVDLVLAALAHAHARGVIHGDLKPSNVLLNIPPDDGEIDVHVLDLGLAWLIQDRIDHRLDGSKESEPTVRWGAGTPGWMAPEQIRFATPHIGPATDLYALGCILFALLANHEPFEGDNEELLNHHKSTPAPLPELAPEVPPEAADFVVRLMNKRPWHRFEFAGDARRVWRQLEPANRADTAQLSASSGVTPSIMPSRNDSTMPDPLGIADMEEPNIVATGLLGLRPAPFVGRLDERQQLADLAQEVAKSARPPEGRGSFPPPQKRFVLLTGDAGVGKSRLAEWLCEEVHEKGVMIPLRARYRKIAAPLDGVVGAVIQHYRLERADRDVIEKVLMNLWDVGPDDNDGLTWVAATAEWLRPSEPGAARVGPTGKRFAFDHPDLRWLVIRRTLERIARTRPLLLWMDDLHHAAPTTFEGVTRIFEESANLPILVIATVRGEGLQAAPHAAQRVDALLRRLGGLRIDLKPFDVQQTHALLRDTLPLSEGAVAEAATRSKGNPLYALQLLHAWAMGGHLELRGGLYEVPESSLAARARTTSELWEERLSAVPAAERPAALAAAALGGDIRRDVFRAQLEELGLEPSRCIPALRRAQILVASGMDRLRWPHALLQEHLLTQLFLQPDAPHIFHAAANALAKHPAAHTRRLMRHRAVNLVRAGQVEAAAELLHHFVVTNWARARDPAATLRDLALLDGKLEGLQKARHQRWKAEALRHAGEPEKARVAAEEARRIFQMEEQPAEEAACLRLLGHIASDMGSPAVGRRLAARGLAIFQDIEDELGAASCELVVGEIDYLLGEHGRARSVLSSARPRLRAAGDRLGHAQCLLLACLIEQAGGSPSASRDLLQMARAEFDSLGYRLGIAQCDVGLAHVDHREADLDQARDVALLARQSFRDLSTPRGEAACERLLCMIEFDMDRFEQADEHATAAEALFERIADPWGQVEIGLLRAQIALANGSLDEAAHHLIACEAVALVEAEPKQHRFLTSAWLACAEERYDDAVRDLESARSAFREASRTGDHTLHLLARFAKMGFPPEVATRIDNWLRDIEAGLRSAEEAIAAPDTVS